MYVVHRQGQAQIQKQIQLQRQKQTQHSYSCKHRRVRTHAMCGKRLFIKRRRVREAATADCQQMAAITYQWLPRVYAPVLPPVKCHSPHRQQAFKLSWQADKARVGAGQQQRLVAVAVEEEAA